MFQRHLKSALRRLTASGYQPLNRIEVSRAALRHNVALIQDQHPGFAVIPVLKGNAYGHGISPVATALREVVPLLAVDGYHEAEAVHAATNHHVLVMGYILPQNVHLLDTRHCTFVVQDIAGLKAFAALRKPVRLHLELATGMNRLGLTMPELGPYLDVLKTHPLLKLDGVMSHLADADNPTSRAFDDHQTAAFDAGVDAVLAAGFRPRLIHLAQTAGSVRIRSRHANAIRLGIGAYGINPLPDQHPQHSALAALQPALELKSTIIKVLDLRPGDKVSYNGTFTASRRMRAGVLPLGYYEGLPRELSNTGCVTEEGRVLPVLGRVCMNHTIIDLGESGLNVGSEVTVISRDPSAPNSVAGWHAHHGLFPYASLTALSSSIRRKIVQ